MAFLESYLLGRATLEVQFTLKLEAPQQTHVDIPSPTAELRNAELFKKFLQRVYGDSL
jgi:hypothetical protein